MYAYEIYTYGGSELFTEVLNAIVMVIGDATFKRLLHLSILFSAAWFTFVCILRRNPFHLSKWFVGYYVVFQILLAPGVTVHLIERTGGTDKTLASQPVDHVPLGLALLAHLTSSLGDGLTQLLETYFSLPNELRYSQTGTVMASRLVTAARHFYLTDPVLNHNLERFFGQCVFYDLRLQKYTLRELADTPNVWSFVKERASPARSFVYQVAEGPAEIVTCREGAAKIDSLWAAAIPEAALRYGKRLFPRLGQEVAKNQLLSLLPVGYGYLTRLTESASTLMQQNLVFNALETGLLRQGAHTNSTAAIEAYAFSKAQQQKRSTYRTLGEMAAYWLPLMKQVFEALMYGSFCIVILFVMFPVGGMVLRHYVMSLLWIQLWAPLYAILNLMVTLYAAHQSAADAGTGITLFMQSGLASVNQDLSALAGYLSLSIPFISMGIVKGMGATMTQLAQYVGGVTQSIGTSTVGEATTGNIGFGNLQLNNRNAFNQSAYHIDENARLNTGSFGYSLPSGGSATLQASGDTVLDNSAAFSNLGVSVNWTRQLRNNFSENRDKAYTAALQEQEAATKLTTAGLRELFELGESIHHQEGTSDQYHQSDAYGLSDTLSELKNTTKNYAKEKGVSIDQGKRDLIAGYGDTHIGVRASGGKEIEPAHVSGEIAGAIGVKAEKSSTDDRVDREHFNRSRQTSHQDNFNHLVEKAAKLLHEETYRTADEKTKTKMRHINQSFESAETHRQESERRYQAADSYHRSVQYLEENGANVTINTNQAFSQWVQAQPMPGNPHQTLGVKAAEILKDPVVAQHYAEKFMEETHLAETIRQQASQKGLGSSAAIHDAYQHMKPIYQPEQLKAVQASQRHEVEKEAERQGMSTDFDQPVDDHLKQDHEKMKASVEAKLADGRKKIEDKQNELKQTVKKQMKYKIFS